MLAALAEELRVRAAPPNRRVLARRVRTRRSARRIARRRRCAPSMIARRILAGLVGARSWRATTSWCSPPNSAPTTTAERRPRHAARSPAARSSPRRMTTSSARDAHACAKHLFAQLVRPREPVDRRQSSRYGVAAKFARLERNCCRPAVKKIKKRLKLSGGNKNEKKIMLCNAWWRGARRVAASARGSRRPERRRRLPTRRHHLRL